MEIRGKSDAEDFRRYFADSICSVGQRFGEADYQTIVKVLYDDPEKVRVLTMLALSAHS